MSLDAYASGSTEPWAASVLATLIRLTRPARILELGTFQGMTTRAISSAAPDASVVTVDIEKRFEGDLGANVTFREMDALTFLRTWGGPPFDFVFVDDDHSFGHVSAEIDFLRHPEMTLTGPGSLIVLHDVIGPFGLDRIVHEHGGWIVELPLLHAAGGLGVIQV